MLLRTNYGLNYCLEKQLYERAEDICIEVELLLQPVTTAASSDPPLEPLVEVVLPFTESHTMKTQRLLQSFSIATDF